ncbi:MAG: DnaD domain protein [Clostridia bacterium]|nr:DnaD domain protein [Clostridia bacterium]
MDFQINPLSYKDVFTLPAEVVNRLKLTGFDQLRFILWVFASKENEFSLKSTADALGMSESDAEECLLFWQDAGLILCDGQKPKGIASEKASKTRVSQKKEELIKPTRNEAVKRASSDIMLTAAVDEIQKKLSRPINSNELISFVWMHDSLGLPVEVILTLVEFCVSEDKTNVRYMEKLANEWALKDIDTLDKAEDMLKKRALSKKAWGKVIRAFGIESRMPSDKELVFSDRWINEWGFSSAMLKNAYNVCIDAKAKLSFAYINQVLSSWHDKGYKTVDDTVKKPQKETSNKSSIDIDEFSKLLENRKIRKGDNL